MTSGMHAFLSPGAVLLALTTINVLNFVDRGIIAGAGTSIRGCALEPCPTFLSENHLHSQGLIDVASQSVHNNSILKTDDDPDLCNPTCLVCGAICDGMLVTQTGLGISEGELGLAQSAFLIGYTACTLIYAKLSERMPAFRLIFLGHCLWIFAVSLSALAGVVDSFPLLLFGRALSGAGEASLATLAVPILDDIAPHTQRSLFVGVYFCAIPLGTALGFAYAGVTTALTGHWEWAFVIQILPMLPLLLFMALFPNHLLEEWKQERDKIMLHRSKSLTRFSSQVSPVIGNGSIVEYNGSFVTTTVEASQISSSTENNLGLQNILENGEQVGSNRDRNAGAKEGEINLYSEQIEIRNQIRAPLLGMNNFEQQTDADFSVTQRSATIQSVISPVTATATDVLDTQANPSRQPATTGNSGIRANKPNMDLIRNVMNRPVFVFTALGFSQFVAVIGGMGFYAPRYIQGMTEWHWSQEKADIMFGLVVAVGGIAGAVIGGLLMDHYAPSGMDDARRCTRGLKLCVLQSALAFILNIITPFVSRAETYFAVVSVAVTIMFTCNTAANSIVLWSVPHHARPTAVALSNIFSHLIGDVPSAPLIGLLSDHVSAQMTLFTIMMWFGWTPILWGIGVFVSMKVERQVAVASE